MTSLDIRNRTNEIIELFSVLNNPTLKCIFIDDVAFSTANWTNVDETTIFIETEAACEALSLEDHSVSSLNLYPNPTTDFFKVQAAARIQKIEISDLSGKRIKTYVHPLETYHVADLTAGLYLVRIETTAGVSTHKLLLSR